MKQVFRNDEAPEFWEKCPPLEDAYRCLCGSQPILVPVRDGTLPDYMKLECANRRCGRVTSPHARLEDAVIEWNIDIKKDQEKAAEDDCERHSWMLVPGTGEKPCTPAYECAHCRTRMKP